MVATHQSSYPYNLPDYVPIFDQGDFCTRELHTPATTWRSEKYRSAGHTNVYVLDHDGNRGQASYCGDDELNELLNRAVQPKLRVLVLQPSVHKRIANGILQKNEQAAKLLKANQLADLNAISQQTALTHEFVPSQLDISQDTLTQVLTHYAIAPAACSHIRGQEQVYGSRFTRDTSGNPRSIQFWYAIRARSFIPEESAEADLKVTVVTNYHFPTKSTFVLLKYRAYNDFAVGLQNEFLKSLQDFIRHPTTGEMSRDPFVVGILHFFPVIQYMRRAARGPRDVIGKQAKMVHDPVKSKDVDIRKLHAALSGLDKDIVQLQFMAALCGRLRKEHDSFYSLIQQQTSPSISDALNVDVIKEIEKFQDFAVYFGEMIRDTRQQTERILDLVFRLNARWEGEAQHRLAADSKLMAMDSQEMTKYTVLESKAMSRIAFITMLFLPGTFITSVLGSNFFTGPDNSSSDTIKVSSQVWILFVVIALVTAAAFAIYHLTSRRWRKNAEASDFRRISKSV